MNAELSEIKRCPFCGSPAIIRKRRAPGEAKGYFVFIACIDCRATGHQVFTETAPDKAGWTGEACDQAIRAWNQRRETV